MFLRIFIVVSQAVEFEVIQNNPFFLHDAEYPYVWDIYVVYEDNAVQDVKSLNSEFSIILAHGSGFPVHFKGFLLLFYIIP